MSARLPRERERRGSRCGGRSGHPHVEGAVGAEGEAANRHVELVTRNAQVQPAATRASHTRNTRRPHHERVRDEKATPAAAQDAVRELVLARAREPVLEVLVHGAEAVA